MTLSTALFALATFLLVSIGLYWAILFLVGLTGLLHPFAATTSDARDHGTVTVLIPVHHEGAAVVDTVGTVLRQDYLGTVAVVVLVEDFEDSSFAPLLEHYPALEARGPARYVATIEDRRSLVVLATGFSRKHDKLNRALEFGDSPFVAVLDADHRATPSWIASALTHFERLDVVAVQSRKAALSTNKIVQVWDSALSHLGHETLNHGLAASGMDVFFTGSTAVFRREVLRQHGFVDTLTEDTYLSFDILLAKGAIAYEPSIGSYEETAPNLGSFAGRRRRWSAGHSYGFFRHLPKLLASPTSGRRKLHCLLIGPFFLLPAVVMLFFMVQGLYYLLQFTPQVQALVLVAAAIGAVLLLLLVSRTSPHRGSDFVVCWLWLLPHVAMSGALYYMLFDKELYYFILEFPYQSAFWFVQLLYIVAAALILVGAWARLRVLRFADLLVYLLTLPLVLFFEVLTSLLGASDYLFGRTAWAKIDRANTVSAGVPSALRSTLRVGRHATARRFLWLPVLFVPLFVLNELGSVDDCGQIRPLLWPPLFASASREVKVDLRLDKRIVDGDKLVLRATVRVDAAPTSRLRLRLQLDGRSVLEDVAELPRRRSFSVEQRMPLGWESRKLRLALSGPGIQCVKKRAFASNQVVLRGKRLVVNGEPFLIKGLIPSFSAARTNLTLERGLAQIKAVGANTARFYHRPGRALLEAAHRAQMLLMLQPDASTWENFDLDSASQRRDYLERFAALARVTRGFPFALLNNIGNEFEINDRSPRMLTNIARLARSIRSRHREQLISYSTFATYLPFPVSVLGINMLDSGSTYWRKALDMVEHFEMPFFASELGGFVAFFERPPVELRRERMYAQWHGLLARGALGGVFFSTHDNWAQPVPPGSYNDPFRPEQPDDQRGFWDERNRAKPELDELAALFADLEATVVQPVVHRSDRRVEVELRNVRPYAVRGIALAVGRARITVGDLAAGERRRLILPLASLRALSRYPRVRLQLRYQTHHGLAGASRVLLIVPEARQRPVVASRDFWPDAPTSGGESLRGRLLRGATLELIVPSGWTRVRAQGKAYPVVAQRLLLPVRTPYHPVIGLSVASRGSWVPLGKASLGKGSSGYPLGLGKRRLRFRIPPLSARQRLLLLSGVGAWRLDLSVDGGPQRRLPAHPYRETLIDLDRLGVRAGQQIVLEINRRSIEYLERRASPSGQPLTIDFDPPRIFAPLEVTVDRAG